MTLKEYYKLQDLCKSYGIELYRSEYLYGYKYYLNGKLQKNSSELRKNIGSLIKEIENKKVEE